MQQHRLPSCLYPFFLVQEASLLPFLLEDVAADTLARYSIILSSIVDVVARYTRALAITPLEVLVARHELIEDVAVRCTRALPL